MEKLWSHTSLGTSLFDVCFLQQHTSLLSPCSHLHSSFSYWLRLLCFRLLYAANTHTPTHMWRLHAHYMTNADRGQLHSPAVRADLLYLYGCLPGCSIYWSHRWNDIPYIFDGKGNNSIYTNLAQGGGRNFQLMGDFFSAFSCFNNPFSKYPPVRSTNARRSQTVTRMLINSITICRKERKICGFLRY